MITFDNQINSKPRVSGVIGDERMIPGGESLKSVEKPQNPFGETPISGDKSPVPVGESMKFFDESPVPLPVGNGEMSSGTHDLLDFSDSAPITARPSRSGMPSPRSAVVLNHSKGSLNRSEPSYDTTKVTE